MFEARRSQSLAQRSAIIEPAPKSQEKALRERLTVSLPTATRSSAITGLSPVLACARNSFARTRVASRPIGYEGGELDVIHAARAKVDFGGFFAVLISARY